MGVLQRIGLAYMFAALLSFRTTLKQQVVIIAALLFGYWFAMTLLPVPPNGFLGIDVLNNAVRDARGVLRPAAARLGQVRQPPLDQQPDVGSRRAVLDHSGRRHRDARHHLRPLDQDDRGHSASDWPACSPSAASR